jgi:RNA polymerase sigma factor (sigma-70 family)
MADDAELLRRYAEDRSEEAFAELVRRYLALVYHAALRQCNDAGQAEDISQSVFIDLARKARSLASRPVLAGWLYTSARYAALRSARTERRRRARELQAQAMTELNEAADPTANWERLRPLIDDALRGLGDLDREAVILRFFEGLPFAEIGALLSVKEDAARMRIDRALERMRRSLGRSGVTSTAAALAAALTTQAGAAVPAGTASKITAAALAAGPFAASVTLLSMTKLQTCIVAALVAAGAAGLAIQHQTNVRLASEVAGLSQAAAENARLRGENARLVASIANKAQSPAAGAARAPEPAKPSGAADDRQVVPLAKGLIPVVTLGNMGRSSPRNAFATQLWAARTGDIALEASSIALGDEARAKLQALAATLPDTIRSEYDTPEKLMAYMLAGSPHPVGGMEILGETDADANDAVLQTQWQHVDDSVVHQTDVVLQQAPDGWRMVVPEVVVDRASAYLSRTIAAQSGAAGGR